MTPAAASNGTGVGDVEAFVEHFATGWARGGGGFVDHFLAVADPDVLLVQPLLPTTRGHEGFRELFGPLFDAVPDLRGEVTRWTPTVDGVMIEMVFTGTVGGRQIEIPNCDRIVLRDGLMTERHAYFDPTPLALAIAARPWAAAPLVRALLAGVRRPRLRPRHGPPDELRRRSGAAR